MRKEEKLLVGSKKISLFPYNIFNISLTSGVKLHVHLWNVVCSIYFFLIPQNLICQCIDFSKYFRESLYFEITRVDCIRCFSIAKKHKFPSRAIIIRTLTGMLIRSEPKSTQGTHSKGTNRVLYFFMNSNLDYVAVDRRKSAARLVCVSAVWVYLHSQVIYTISDHTYTAYTRSLIT